jgi:hypothetical protein
VRQAAALSLALAGAAGCAGPAAPASDSYVAQREIVQARLDALYQADREALEKARAAARRLAADAARRAAFFADMERRRRDEDEAQARLHAARRAALEGARGDAEVIERPPGLLFRLAAEALFLPGTSLLCAGADARLAALADALCREPACDVRLVVLDDVDGFRTDAWQLAERRVRRVEDALRAHGVPGGAFLPGPRRVAAGTQVDVLVDERPAPPALLR